MNDQSRDRGFVLITAMVVLLILTVMAVGLYFRSVVNQKTSSSDRDATKAYYLAETALNYVVWAIHSDPQNSAVNNDIDLDGDGVSDRAELLASPDQVANNTLGYFDISDTATRAINFSDPASPPSPVLRSVAPWSDNGSPTLPKHFTLDISSSGGNASITLGAWTAGSGFPAGDGAIVWLTAGVDPSQSINVDMQGVPDTSGAYTLIAYAVSYVNGVPMRLLRSRIGTVDTGFPSDLGSLTNGFQ